MLSITVPMQHTKFSKFPHRRSLGPKLTTVSPWGLNDPTEGERITVTDPWDKVASEFGWNSDGTKTYDTTWGNNGVAQSNWDGKTSNFEKLPRPQSKNLDFEYPYSLEESDWKSYINASITQLFYTANKYHDLLYKLGFTEAAGNFETNNNGQGGVGNDFVYLNAQDGAGMYPPHQDQTHH
jgi:extracellular elastinolytic metalloproteinase